MPPAGAQHYVLRAEILAQRSEPDAALADIETALDIVPHDLQANRRLLAWGKGEQRVRAATILCDRDDHSSVLIEAAKILKRVGRCALGSIKIFDTNVRGWAAWSGSIVPELVLRGGEFEERLPLQIDPHHILKKSGFKNCANFNWPRDPQQKLREVQLQLGGKTILSERVPNLEGFKPATLMTLNKAKRVRQRKPDLTIVIPIYRDFEATRACLESLQRETGHIPGCKVILVNDVSPEAKMAPYLESFALKNHATLLTNHHNLGFVGSVNRALESIHGGDIVLLNSDTVLPGTALRRLLQTARADPRIGTITPLSNNGEFTSFPISLSANPLPNRSDLRALDRAAAQVNNSLVVDIPSGIGFCLYISAACFAAVGGLSDSFHGGYLEDVDFCLRAREKGFRNVCDPSIFVAHAGSRSFLTNKRNLVLRNLPIIEERFPFDKAETEAFLRLDPLRTARANIERKMTPRSTFDILLVTGEGIVQSIAEARAHRLQKSGQRIWFAVVADGTVSFNNAAMSMPRSLRFCWKQERERSDLQTYLRSLRFERIELANPSQIPSSLLSLLSFREQRVDLLMADCRWMLSSNEQHLITHALIVKALSKKSRIVAPCARAREFALASFPEWMGAIVCEEEPRRLKPLPIRRRKMPKSEDKCAICGIIAYGRLIDDYKFIREVALAMERFVKASSFIVLGETFDDLSLMTLNNIYVTGAIDPAELGPLCRLYGVEKLFAATRAPLFGHPLETEARKSALPFANFDWSGGVFRQKRRDLAFDPHLEANAVALQLAGWMSWPM